jgi:hypothetical protein
MEEIFLNLANKLAERVETLFAARVFPKLELFFKQNVRLCFTEEEAAELLKMEKSTLADKRRKSEINYYLNGKCATYGIHHLQDYLARREIRSAPQIHTVKREISLLGIETETRPRRVG